jgi:hypothetical protein
VGIVVLACLIPQDVNPQLKGHLVGALNNGATEDEVKAVREVVIKGTSSELSGLTGASGMHAAIGKCCDVLETPESLEDVFQKRSTLIIRTVCEASGMKQLNEETLDGWGWREPVAPVKLPKSSKL